MKKFLNSVFLISGTAIGSGLISLPLYASKIGLLYSFIVILISFYVAYFTSSLTINLNEKYKSGASIVELSSRFSGNIAKTISILTFYLLSIALLSVYFSGTVSIAEHFFSLKNSTFVFLAVSILFFILFFSNKKIFEKISSLLFVMLITSLIIVLSLIYKQNAILKDLIFTDTTSKVLLGFLPIIFTSFGVQNVCPYVYENCNKDSNIAKKAFFVGILIAALVYCLYIFLTLTSIYSINSEFYNKIAFGNIDAGEFVSFLCSIGSSSSVRYFFKLLSLFAIITSAIGIGIGLKISLYEIFGKKNEKYIVFFITIVPAILSFLIQNAFMKILAFGGMIATIFVIFMPIYLTKKSGIEGNYKIGMLICLIFGTLIVFSELISFF